MNRTILIAGAVLSTSSLLLVDYRLPQGRTGIDALVALRAHWPSLPSQLHPREQLARTHPARNVRG